MTSKTLSRKEKIELLNNLQKRKISISEIFDEATVIWIFDGQIYTGTNNIVLSEADFNEYRNRHRMQHHVVLKPCKGHSRINIQEP